MIIEGDESWGKVIEDDRCPRCEGQVTMSGESQARCTICGLMIGYNSAKEESMLTESEAKPIEELTWSDAVHVMEEVINEKLKTLDTKEDEDLDRAMKVALAWHRILRG
jgi:hypothetical protein|tara:strand:+ start:4875 stop:5201 length:327 start_codon:yes stop_codon:yes gene_type:complete